MPVKRRPVKAKPAAGTPSRTERKLHDAAWIEARLEDFAQEIIAQGVLDHALIIGIKRRGAELARRVRARVERHSSVRVPLGALDVTLYRDDGAMHNGKVTAQKGGTELEADLNHRVVYLVDDVLCTGRTIRAALDQMMDFGRPGAVRLFSLIDRGGRELPMQPDRSGERIAVPAADRIEVRLKEVDGEEGVYSVVGGMRGSA